MGRVGERIRVVEKRSNPNSKVQPVVTRSRFSAHLLQSSLIRQSSQVSGSHPAFRPEWQADTPAKTIQRKLRTRDQACTLMRQRIVGRDAAIGLAWDCQEVPALPLEPHERALDAIVTPTRLLGPFER